MKNHSSAGLWLTATPRHLIAVSSDCKVTENWSYHFFSWVFHSVETLTSTFLLPPNTTESCQHTGHPNLVWVWRTSSRPAFDFSKLRNQQLMHFLWSTWVQLEPLGAQDTGSKTVYPVRQMAHRIVTSLMLLSPMTSHSWDKQLSVLKDGIFTCVYWRGDSYPFLTSSEQLIQYYCPSSMSMLSWVSLMFASSFVRVSVEEC